MARPRRFTRFTRFSVSVFFFFMMYIYMFVYVGKESVKNASALHSVENQESFEDTFMPIADGINEQDYHGASSVVQSRPELKYLKDFRQFPCIGGYKSPTLQQMGRCVRAVNANLLSQTQPKGSKCVPYKLANSTPICVYNPKDDIFISGDLITKGTWEGGSVDDFGRALIRYNITDVLDIGCNIGVYTLAASKLVKRVVALDANVENLRLLSKSLVLGNLTNKVLLVWNAISDVYTNVSLTPAPRNIGGKQVEPVDKIQPGKSSENEVYVETVKLDDLEDIFRDRRVAFKMDIETAELMAVRGGKTFFQNIDVRFIQMEIEFHKRKQSGKEIVDILTGHGFRPFVDCSGDQSLANVSLPNWPYDMCFKR